MIAEMMGSSHDSASLRDAAPATGPQNNGGADSTPHISAETGMRPIRHALYPAMHHRIPMNMVGVMIKVSMSPHDRFPRAGVLFHRVCSDFAKPARLSRFLRNLWELWLLAVVGGLGDRLVKPKLRGVVRGWSDAGQAGEDMHVGQLDIGTSEHARSVRAGKRGGVALELQRHARGRARSDSSGLK